MSNPRLIATTASAALIAGVGAGAAVYAVDIVTTGNEVATVADSANPQSEPLQQPQDERTTVYREPSDDDDHDDDSGGFQQSPPDTQYNQGSAKQNKSNTSKSS